MTRLLKVVAVVEAATYLVLLCSVVAHRAFDAPDVTASVGPLHGVAFLAYFALVVQVREVTGWGALRTLGILAAAVVPFGGFVVGHRLLR